jgi:hypothetical protein
MSESSNCPIVVANGPANAANGPANGLGKQTKHALLFLSVAQLVVGLVMGSVYVLGKESYASWLLIYGPITMIALVCFRDKMDLTFTVSCLLSITHGIAHNVYPFLDEHHGVVRSVDVWQDQIVHLGQAVLFGIIVCHETTNKSWRWIVGLFVVANICNVVLGYFCWGKWCHNQYVWLSLAPALASGLHFAMGCFSGTIARDITVDNSMAMKGFGIQGMSSISTYFLFKSSDDILKLFARCRFFEVYFIIPHYVGFFHTRYVRFCQNRSRSDTRSDKMSDKRSDKRSDPLSDILQIMGILPIRSSDVKDVSKQD